MVTTFPSINIPKLTQNDAFEWGKGERIKKKNYFV